jgi:cyanophycin synthetase
MAANLDDGERRVSAIIGFPGDWSDKMLAQAGYLASRCFDRITLRENHDLRGRVSGETVQILYQAIKGGAPEQDCRIILSEDEALRREITRLRENDILICFTKIPNSSNKS